jgi:hypothetical protein
MRCVRLWNQRERRASYLPDVSELQLGSDFHENRTGVEMSRAVETQKDESAAAKRAQTELTARVGSPLERQTTSWKRLLRGRRKAPTAS